MAWGDDARQAITDNPDYFVWWYTVKSVGLGVVAAGLAYWIGKSVGAKEERQRRVFENRSGGRYIRGRRQ